jgi:hypothetical protein
MNGYKNVLEYHQQVSMDPTLALDLRDSVHFRAPKTRPLCEKLECMLDLIFRWVHPSSGHHCRAHPITLASAKIVVHHTGFAY